MAYTKKTFTSPSIFGGQAVDGNRVAIQGVASGFITQDGTGTPQVSPLALTTAVTTIVVPNNAVRVVLRNLDATNAVLVSELVGMTQTFSIPAGSTLTLDVSRQSNIYVKSAVTSSLSFLFQLID